MEKTMSVVLVVDDESRIREFLVRWLQAAGYETAEAGDADSGLAVAIARQPDVILCDVRMAGHDGLWLVGQVREQLPHVPIILATGVDTIPPAVSMQGGVVAYLVKPFEKAVVLAAVSDALTWRAQAASRPPAAAVDPVADWLRGRSDRRQPPSDES
jgi:DNA-binding NtrC family response regulator